MSFLGKKSIAKRISAFFVLLVLLPSSIFCLRNVQISIREDYNERINETRNILHIFAEDISSKAYLVENLISLLSSDAIVRKISNMNVDAYAEYASFLIYELEPSLSKTSAYLYGLGAELMLITTNTTLPERYETIMHLTHFSDENTLQEVAQNGGSSWGEPGYHMPLGLANQNYYNKVTVPYYKSVNTINSTPMGVLKCSVDLDRLFAILYTWDNEEPIYILHDGKIIFRIYNTDKATSSIIDEYKDKSGNIVVSYPIDNLNIQLTTEIAAIDKNAIIKTVLPSIGITFITMIAIITITLWLVKRLLRGFDLINRMISNVEENKPFEPIVITGSDEISRIFNAFNNLMMIRESQTTKLVEAEKEAGRSKILALQCQMNPHFLFNALNWIQLCIETGRLDENASEAIVCLCNVLHYNMSLNPVSTIGEELISLEQYIEFLNLRNPDTVLLHISCPTELLGSACLRFTLQPLAENAIRHGKNGIKTLNIYLDYQRTGKGFEIVMRNDGRLPTSVQIEEINQILSQEVEYRGESVGLVNLVRRLHILHSDVDVCLCIENEMFCVDINVSSLHEGEDYEISCC